MAETKFTTPTEWLTVTTPPVSVCVDVSVCGGLVVVVVWGGNVVLVVEVVVVVVEVVDVVAGGLVEDDEASAAVVVVCVVTDPVPTSPVVVVASTTSGSSLMTIGDDEVVAWLGWVGVAARASVVGISTDGWITLFRTCETAPQEKAMAMMAAMAQPTTSFVQVGMGELSQSRH